MTGDGRPLVSIFMFVRNGAQTVERALRSIQAQTYPNIEFVVQDGTSTDGTLDIVRGYGTGLKLVSEPDDGPGDALVRAMNRCSGDIVGSCLADEELLPDAVERAVLRLRQAPDVGVVTSDCIITDVAGKQNGFWKSGPFNLVDYLLCDYCPYWVSSFFRRQALVDAGLGTHDWNPKCVEFEMWCRLAGCCRIEYVAGANAKYAAHPGQSSNNTRDVAIHFEGRLKHILSMCRADPLLAGDPLLPTLFIWGHARTFINHAITFGRTEIPETLYRITKQSLAELPAVDLDGFVYDERYGLQVSARDGAQALARHLPAAIRRLLGPATEQALRLNVQKRLLSAQYDRHQPGQVAWKALLKGWLGAGSAPANTGLPILPPPPTKPTKTRLYVEMADRYAAVGRPSDALDMWRAAGRLNGILPDEPVGFTPIEA